MRFRSVVVVAVCATVLLAGSHAFAQLRAVTFVSGLSSPVAFVQDPSDPTVQYVVQQGGRIRLIRNAVLQTTPFLDLTSNISSGGERGLLGMALPADYATSGRFYVNFTNPAGHTVVARFKRSADPLIADAGSRFDLLWSTGERFIQQPFANHNGGNIVFGPDGFLYIGMGDGGAGNDPQHNAQNPASLLGKMLRIDVSVPDGNNAGLAIPADNPFRQTSAPEIWSFGLRNPWRWSFDDPARGGTGALVIGDVGQNAFEEIDYEPAGRGGLNYGWRNREGAHDTNITPNLPPAFQPLVDPIHEYGRSSGASVTGGFVYRGTALGSTFQGRYFFGDFISGRIWSIALTVSSTTGAATASDLRDHTAELSSASVSSFGVDSNGELYFVNYNGSVRRIESTSPTMTVDKASLAFGATLAGGAFSSQTSAQTIRLTQAGAGTVTWTATSSAPWLAVSPASGTGNATLSVSVQPSAGLTASQTATITLSFTGAGATPAPIQVTLTTSTTGTSASPIGSFDTPIDGVTGVTGSIAVSGWALDDVEVTGVRIFRDPVAGEPAGQPVFVGDATLVEGARPDVQALFPSAPRASRAGWGYLMLTNFLPGLGTGTFTLHAIAADADGHSAVLGSRTITCANSGATAPFGAIDTPTQGGTVSGTVTNFGWVLSPGTRRADPPGGGMVQLAIDGAISSAVPTGWTSRPDLSALFPVAQYAGIGTALGVASFDSTALTNGVHTIAWVVTDNQGVASGIGSRYFTVSNGSSLTQALNGPPGPRLHRDLRERSVTGRRGFDPAAPYREYGAEADGRITIQAEELDRIELALGAGASGYAVVAGARAPLPIGARIDPATGVFTWHPGTGFLGPFDLVLAGHDVRIVLDPKGSGRVGPQVVIDLPAGNVPPKGGSDRKGEGDVVSATDVRRKDLTIAGWAADLDSTIDSGVDTVHVWAYPSDGSDPIFVGVAAYGGAQPDVAAIYGQRFLKSGYGLRVDGLAPGTYDLAVFPYSTVQGRFAPAKTVRITVR